MCHVGRVVSISDDIAPQLVRRTFVGLHSAPCPLTLEVLWGVATPGMWAARLIVKVYTSAQSKTGISAVLTVMGGLGILCIMMMTYVCLTVQYLSFSVLHYLCYFDHGLMVCQYHCYSC